MGHAHDNVVPIGIDLGPEWETEAPGYSPYGFYTKSKDDHGHTSNTQTPFLPEVKARIAKIVNGGQYPQYDSVQDFVRDAVVHRLHQLQEISNDPDFKAEQQALIEAVTYDAYVHERQAAMVKMQQRLDRTRDSITQSLSFGDIAAARAFLTKSEEYCESLASPWRERFEELNRQFRNQLNGR